MVTAASIDLQLVDSLGHTSSTLNAAPLAIRELAQSCDPAIDAPDQCHHELVCTSSTCAAGSAQTAACGAAATLTSGTAMTDMIQATATALFEGSCFFVPGAGGEKVYKVTVPALIAGQTGYDVVASTGTTDPFDQTTMLDTYVYVRSTCANPATEVACNDDIDPDNGEYRSQATAGNQPAGTYFIFVSTSSRGTGPGYSINVNLRPVLASGETCDPTGTANRCRGNPCPTTGTPTCP
jgi:hypothetical protein